jgi:predicted nucleic acid-binding protein
VIALDTNLLLRLADPTSGQHSVAVAAVGKLWAAGESLVIFPQNVYEFWSTATRPPKSNGLGLTVPACLSELTRLRQSFPLFPDQPGLFDEWFTLVVRHQCSGKVSYDARIVAAMGTHAMTRLLTFNTADFARYPGLTVLDPATV